MIIPNRIEILKQKLAQSVGLPNRSLLPESDIIAAIVAEKIKYRNRLFNPIVTIWAFLSQVLDTDKSLQNVVSRVIAWLAQAGEPVPSTDTGGYSKARKRLPEGLLKRLLGQTAHRLEKQADPADLWCGRRVRICDGSSVLMSDTPENQAVYPQHSNQAKGCGFPIAKIVVMFSLATGAAMEVLMAAFNKARSCPGSSTLPQSDAWGCSTGRPSLGNLHGFSVGTFSTSRCSISQTPESQKRL